MTSSPDPESRAGRYLHLSRFLPEDDDASDLGAHTAPPDAASAIGPSAHLPTEGLLTPANERGEASGAAPDPEPVRDSRPEPEGRSEPLTGAPTGSVDAVRLLDHATAESIRILSDAHDRAARILDQACSDAAAAAVRIMDEARREANQLLTKARSEADAVREQAVAETTRLRMECDTAVLAARDEAAREAKRRHLELEQEARSRRAELEAESVRVVTDARQQALVVLKEAEREREEMLAQARREADRLLDLGAHALAGAERQAAALLQATMEEAPTAPPRPAGQPEANIRSVFAAAPSQNEGVVSMTRSEPEWVVTDAEPEQTVTDDAGGRSEADGQADAPNVPVPPTTEGVSEALRFEPVIGSRGRVAGAAGAEAGGPAADAQPWGATGAEPTRPRRRRRRAER